MSTGPRLPLAAGISAAAHLMRLWGMTEPACAVVGSVRRGRDTVGDLEFIAPLPDEGEVDALYQAIDATVGTSGLFGADTVPVGRAIKGVKPRFLSASVVMSMRVTADAGGEPFEIPVQVERYLPTGVNRGWKEIMRTGPAGFGEWFLARWKQAQRTLWTNPASEHGCLVDANRHVVPVYTELEAFTKCGLKYIAPADRDTFMERMSTRMPAGGAR